MMDSGLVGRGFTRAEDAQGTPTRSHISPSILVYEEKRGTDSGGGRGPYKTPKTDQFGSQPVSTDRREWPVSGTKHSSAFRQVLLRGPQETYEPRNLIDVQLLLLLLLYYSQAYS